MRSIYFHNVQTCQHVKWPTDRGYGACQKTGCQCGYSCLPIIYITAQVVGTTILLHFTLPKVETLSVFNDDLWAAMQHQFSPDRIMNHDRRQHKPLQIATQATLVETQCLGKRRVT